MVHTILLTYNDHDDRTIINLKKGVIFFLVCAGFTVFGIATGHYLWKDPAGWEGQSVAMGESTFRDRSAAPSLKNKSNIVHLYNTIKKRLIFVQNLSENSIT